MKGHMSEDIDHTRHWRHSLLMRWTTVVSCVTSHFIETGWITVDVMTTNWRWQKCNPEICHGPLFLKWQLKIKVLVVS